ncbi:MAG: ABC transporter permease [Desulfobacterales bacterium]|jgi:putative ABC transport system permease protein
MILNYFKIAIRNIIKHKGYSIINITGLAIGLAIFSLIVETVEFHFSFDRFHKDADRIHSIVQVLPSGTADERHSALAPAPLRRFLINEFEEIADATRLIPTGRWIVRSEDSRFYAEEGSVWGVDANFFSLFSFKMVDGRPKTALSKPGSVVLTESIAHRYFGTENPIGKPLRLNDIYWLTVTGVTKDVPSNSSLKYGMLVSSNTFNWEFDWSTKCATYVRLAEQVNLKRLGHKFKSFTEKNLSKSPVFPKHLYLLPLVDQYLKSLPIRGIWRQDSKMVYYLILAIGIVLLLVVCFNFMNLTTAQYLTRAKEIGVRKAAGASRRQLIWQYLSESILIALISLVLAQVFSEMMRPLFLYLTAEDKIPASPGIWSNNFLIIKLLFVAIIVGTIAGSYPSFFLSGFCPDQILRGRLFAGKKGTRIRQTLVVLQFFASILLVLLSLTIFKQYNYLRNIDLGYNRHRVLVVALGTNFSRWKLRPLQEDLRRHPAINSVSAAVWLPIDWNSELQVVPQGADKNDARTMNAYAIDYGFIELLEMKVVKGRSFSRTYNDSAGCIINETAARQLQWQNPIGKKLTFHGKTGTVVGVVKDFHFKNLFYKNSPSVIYLHPRYLNFLYVKLANDGLAEILNYLENRWRIFSPEQPFEYFWLNDRFNHRLRGEKQAAALIGSFAVFTTIFSCLGLGGLVSYATQRRTKEIGIRKAHGATVSEIIRLYLIEFIGLIVIANVIAWPVAFFLLNKILQYAWAYSFTIGPGIFAFVGALTTLVGLVAVLAQIIKSARANPIDALRYE